VVIEHISKFVDQRKWAKLRWLQDPGQNSAENMDIAKRETGRHFKKE
jgi:hypothetical protein